MREPLNTKEAPVEIVAHTFTPKEQDALNPKVTKEEHEAAVRKAIKHNVLRHLRKSPLKLKYLQELIIGVPKRKINAVLKDLEKSGEVFQDGNGDWFARDKEDLAKYQKDKVEKFLQEKGWKTFNDLADAMQLPKATLKRYLNELKQSGIVKGPDKYGWFHWYHSSERPWDGKTRPIVLQTVPDEEHPEEDLDKYQKDAIEKFLRSHGPTCFSNLADSMQFPIATLKRFLNELKESGTVCDPVRPWTDKAPIVLKTTIPDEEHPAEDLSSKVEEISGPEDVSSLEEDIVDLKEDIPSKEENILAQEIPAVDEPEEPDNVKSSDSKSAERLYPDEKISLYPDQLVSLGKLAPLLPDNKLAVLLALERYLDPGTLESDATQDQIAKITGKSLRTIRNYLKDFKRSGLLGYKRIWNGQNCYYFDMPVSAKVFEYYRKRQDRKKKSVPEKKAGKSVADSQKKRQ
ncbi:MAG: hypothetical protein ACLQPD_06475 [Desulfomonilaceae bacterium]